jgi:hypothetical protein
VNSPVDLAPRPSSTARPVHADDELGLAELLELCAADDVPATSPLHSLRSTGSLLRGWALDSSRRAARWGAVDGVVS